MVKVITWHTSESGAKLGLGAPIVTPQPMDIGFLLTLPDKQLQAWETIMVTYLLLVSVAMLIGNKLLLTSRRRLRRQSNYIRINFINICSNNRHHTITYDITDKF